MNKTHSNLLKKFQNVHCLVENPLVKHKITLLRDKKTTSKDFREILEELTFIIAVEASEHLKFIEKVVETPISQYCGIKVKPSMIVPIMRAGIGMINPLLKLFPSCKLGFMGLSRNEDTLIPHMYYSNMPKFSNNETIFILDPMLATGGSLSYTVKYLLDNGAKDIVVLTILSTPKGIENLNKVYDKIIIYTAEIDDALNNQGFIVPGLGDAGDRIFNT